MQQPLRQRVEYTHKLNLKNGRHGWLRLTPAYSVRIVEELIEQCGGSERILDPFCGTATTALSAANNGHSYLTIDVNPFLVWLGRAKTARYARSELRRARAAAAAAAALVGRIEPAAAPPIHNIARWWPADALEFLCSLKAAIDAVSETDSKERALLQVAFCRTLISLSNAAFNHQSMSFNDSGQRALALELDKAGAFRRDMEFVLAGAADNPEGEGLVIEGDSRYLDEGRLGRFGRVITSPPYVNRMSYIRELRPYMYWLGYLADGRDAGEMDWKAIGGTWGIATSRLADWKAADEGHLSPVLKEAIERVAAPGNPNGVLLANYISRYFFDMRRHFASLARVLNPGAEVHYIVGNSTFYGVLLPAEALYAEALREMGFGKVECVAIRKRNSKKELVEFDVRAVAPSTATE